jgi:translation initiation factor 3 subunit B
LLTKKHIKELKKNLKKYSEEFDAKDIMRMSKASQELMDKRKNNYDEFMAYRGKRAADLAEQREQRMALRDDQDTDGIQTAAAAADSEDMDEEVVEFLVKEEESIID